MPVLLRKFEKRVEYEIKVINKKLEIYREELLDVQREASWFPFPKLLTEFNGDFNYCADKIYWIKTQQLNVAETFRKTQRYLDRIDDRLRKLRKRLVTLRVIRDSTLFIMLLGRSFIWLEVVFLGLALLCIPMLIYYSNNFQSNFIVDMIIRQKWEFQKGLILILSILALAIAAFRAAVVSRRRRGSSFSSMTVRMTIDLPITFKFKAFPETNRKAFLVGFIKLLLVRLLQNLC